MAFNAISNIRKVHIRNLLPHPHGDGVPATSKFVNERRQLSQDGQALSEAIRLAPIQCIELYQLPLAFLLDL